ncbi:hypothetical protein [Neobacillus mesonae]|uniref:Uncharacterized protein n=1 Tax=Neobacillus mesonae TaxID=1193713 RepID=A0A3T0HV65_9BACI|nr:hypothetical protein [Neobacillus mesonae]AZU61019.1 hypothetical protein CHR53_07005 [Neobacillus mesonae]
MNKPDFNFGDLVRVAGYHPRIFEVDGRRIEHWQYSDEEWTDIVYELYDVATSDWIEASEEDLTLVAEADQAEEYLAVNPAPVEPSLTIDISKFFGGVTNMAKQERKPTARELSAKEAEERRKARKEREAEINNLLDIARWNRKMLEKTNDEAYGDRLFAVEAELKKLVENE